MALAPPLTHRLSPSLARASSPQSVGVSCQMSARREQECSSTLFTSSSFFGSLTVSQPPPASLSYTLCAQSLGSVHCCCFMTPERRRGACDWGNKRLCRRRLKTIWIQWRDPGTGDFNLLISGRNGIVALVNFGENALHAT